ncbi:MAG: hypothetical protein JNL40_08365 [Cyclobacteriaceae bacterium]|nr:hypothetical protein [Cyclobacteriaceae bacterium]
MAQVAFHVSDHVARSPLRAPFGSFLFSDRAAPQGLYDFVHQVERQLSKRGVSIVTLTEPPSVYRTKGALLHTILLNQGYRISNAELSSCIRIDRLDFEEKIEAWEKRKIKQAKQKGVVVRILPIDQLALVYQFIQKCREQRSHTLSMTLPELEATARPYQHEFVLSGAFLHKEMVAASIAIRVHPNILYNFYSGHLKKHDSFSPMVMLLGGLYRYCEKQNIQLLDLGTSSLHGQPNFTLLDFKLRLGAEPSIKLSFEKQLG